jgi:hypothetical protein
MTFSCEPNHMRASEPCRVPPGRADDCARDHLPPSEGHRNRTGKHDNAGVIGSVPPGCDEDADACDRGLRANQLRGAPRPSAFRSCQRLTSVGDGSVGFDSCSPVSGTTRALRLAVAFPAGLYLRFYLEEQRSERSSTQSIAGLHEPATNRADSLVQRCRAFQVEGPRGRTPQYGRAAGRGNRREAPPSR